MADFELSLFLAGDATLAAPWSHVETPAFLALIGEMRAADVTIVNLETVVHDFRGYAQADSGGTWCASPPIIAQELAWAGVDMVSHANNHAFDYGSEGVLETVDNIARAGIALAGSGKDLDAATRPAAVTVRGTKVALVAMAETFVAYGRASQSRPDIRGRPGVNPLAVIHRTEFTVTARVAALMKGIDGWLGRDVRRYGAAAFRRFGRQFRIGSRNGILKRGSRIVDADRSRNLAAIAIAVGTADLTIVSIHTHRKAAWLPGFVRDAIGAGAGIVLVHGPHEIQGVEFVAGRPVFHGLGGFVYEADKFAVLPSDAYDQLGLDDRALPADVNADRRTGPGLLSTNRKTFEGCAALVRYDAAKRPAVTLLPIDLQFDGDAAVRGRPQLADRELGRRLTHEITAKSKRYGTAIRYDAASNTGIVEPAM